MARWRQVKNEETGRYEMVRMDARPKNTRGIDIIRGNFDTFVSPVDGSLITDHRSLAQHNARNNVVNAQEFTPEYYAGKAKERAQHFTGTSSKEDTHKRRQQINEIWNHQERNRNE